MTKEENEPRLSPTQKKMTTLRASSTVTLIFNSDVNDYLFLTELTWKLGNGKSRADWRKSKEMDDLCYRKEQVNVASAHSLGWDHNGF